VGADLPHTAGCPLARAAPAGAFCKKSPTPHPVLRLPGWQKGRILRRLDGPVNACQCLVRHSRLVSLVGVDRGDGTRGGLWDRATAVDRASKTSDSVSIGRMARRVTSGHTSAEDRSDRASVPGLRRVRSESRRRSVACSESSRMFTRFVCSAGTSLPCTSCVVLCMAYATAVPASARSSQLVVRSPGSYEPAVAQTAYTVSFIANGAGVW
jgi:hypothetical protein